MSGKVAPDYSLGGKNQLKWKEKYFFGPKGIGFLEPGVVGLDDATMSAYNVAKSSYQIHPEVFNLDYLVKSTGLKKTDISKRMLRMYDEHYMMYVMNPATQVYGWGLYYWFVKLKEGTSLKIKRVCLNGFRIKTIFAPAMSAMAAILISTTAITCVCSIICCRA